MKSIKTRLIVFFSIVLILITSTISFLGYNKALNGMNELKIELLSQKLEGDISSSTYYLKQYFGNLSYGNGQLIDEEGNNIEGRNELVDDILDDMGVVATIFVKSGDDFKRITTNILKDNGDRAVGTYLGKESSAYKDLIQGKQYIGEADILGTPHLTVYKPIKDHTGNVIGILFVGVSEEESNKLVGVYLSELRNSFLFITIVGVIIAVFAVSFVSKSIAVPIMHLSQIIERLSKYDISSDENSVALNYLKRKDEIGTITQSLETMQNNFISLIKNIADTSQQVAASSEELTATSQQSAIAAEEIAKTIEEIASGANDQAKETEEGATNINVLGELIEEDQKHLIDLNISADEVNVFKDDGLEVLEDLIEKTNANNKATEDVRHIIVSTNDSAEKIEKASQMIKSISDQTNLLALNAAIEAARAGEAGKGFAVVAEEIRKLAEQSNSFTDEIATVIQELISKTGHAVNTMQEVGKIVELQTESVEKTNEKFIGIATAIEKMKKEIDGINQSSRAMESKKYEIIDVIENLSAIAQENAAGTEEAAASVEEQTASMEQIASASEALAKLAEEMQENIAKFKY